MLELDGNRAPKLAITVDPAIHQIVVDAAASDGVSVSAWLTEAARRRPRIRDGLQGVAEWEAEHGALTDEEMATARRGVAALLTSAATGRRGTTGRTAKSDLSPRPRRAAPA